jgi:hypothetical protein
MSVRRSLLNWTLLLKSRTGDFGAPRLLQFACRCNVAKFVKEIEDKHDPVIACGGRIVWNFELDKSPAVGVQIEVVVCAAPGELAVREQLRLFSAECVSLDRIGDNHDFLVEGPLEQFVRRSRPNRETTPAVRNLPFSFGARKRAHVDLERSRLARLICDPSSVWRKYRIRIDKRAGPKNRRLTRFPAGLLIPFHWKDHDVRPGPRAVSSKRRNFSLGCQDLGVCRSFVSVSR